MALPNLLGELFSRSCAHEFLLPHRHSGGAYYQTCAEKMAPVSSQHQPNLTSLGTLIPRARRFIVRKPMFYRATGGAQLKLGVLLDISKSGVLLQCQSQIFRGQELEMLFEMPQEISGQANRTVLSEGMVVRIASTDIGSPFIGVKLSGYRFLAK